MKIRNLHWIAFCLAVGCGETTPDEVQVESALLAAWHGPISEEAPNNWMTCPGQGISAARCQGGYCDNISIYCVDIQKSGATVPTVAVGWTGWISEETPPTTPYQHNGHTVLGNTIGCEMSFGTPLPVHQIMDGIQASGSNADDISIHCATLQGHDIDGGSCHWTNPFSEETPCTPTLPAGYCMFSGNEVATAVRCTGSKCDNMAYLVCNVL
jgi:hypothetical protein